MTPTLTDSPDAYDTPEVQAELALFDMETALDRLRSNPCRHRYAAELFALASETAELASMEKQRVHA